MMKLIDPRTGEAQEIEVQIVEPITRELGPVVVRVDE